MANVLHSAPKIAEIDGIADTLAGALGDMLIHAKEQHGEVVLSVVRERVEDALRLRSGIPASDRSARSMPSMIIAPEAPPSTCALL